MGYNLLVLWLSLVWLLKYITQIVGMSASSIIVVSNSLRLLKEQGK
ncbi:hypothetical protein OH492_25810 [Vibrio chagasii]|nr:hypothetical protein [Vibrio chagasii]